MGLFSSGSKDRALSRHSGKTIGQSGAKRRVRVENARQQESSLDPELPEKQRARRRLVGAILLVLAAVIVLPMVLDSRPPPFATQNIQVDIAKPSSLNPAHSVASKTSHVIPRASSSSGKSGALPESQLYAHAVPLKSGPPATPATGRFVVLAGVFGSDAAARAGLKALKAVGVPAYLERMDQQDGTPRIVLRAGPFSDRTSAEAAAKKIRQTGLGLSASSK